MKQTKADKKAYYIEWRKRPESILKIKACKTRYRASEKGRANILENTAKHSERRRQIAAAKAGIVLVKPGESDAPSVQRALTMWGGL